MALTLGENDTVVKRWRDRSAAKTYSRYISTASDTKIVAIPDAVSEAPPLELMRLGEQIAENVDVRQDGDTWHLVLHGFDPSAVDPLDPIEVLPIPDPMGGKPVGHVARLLPDPTEEDVRNLHRRIAKRLEFSADVSLTADGKRINVDTDDLRDAETVKRMIGALVTVVSCGGFLVEATRITAAERRLLRFEAMVAEAIPMAHLLNKEYVWARPDSEIAALKLKGVRVLRSCEGSCRLVPADDFE